MTTTLLRPPTTRTWHRPLLVLTAASAVLTVVTAVGIFADPQLVTNSPAFLKPFKFSISFTLYGLTLAWLLASLPRRSRFGERAGTVVVGSAVVELAIIVTQAARGRPSHYNVATPLDTALFAIMGVSIMALFVAHAIVSVAALRQRIGDRPLTYAIRSGLLLTLLGMLAAVPMVSPLQDPGIDTVAGAHSVGVPDGGPGMPLTGWSTTGGDLRIGHFIGLHGMQALPLLALGLAALARRSSRRRGEEGGKSHRGEEGGNSRLDETTRARLILVAAVAYGMLVILTTGQALRGQPLLSPDLFTLTTWTALVLGTGAATAAVLRRGVRS